MANTNDWGKGSANNTNDWGKGAINNTNDWGQVYPNSPSGETNIGVSVGPPPVFSPLDLSPNLWLDATDANTITEVSGDVSQWGDKSGNSNNVSQSDATLRPSNGGTINGNNALDWGTTIPSSDSLRLSRGSTTDNWQDVYIVGRYGLASNTFGSNPTGVFTSTNTDGTDVGLGLSARADGDTFSNIFEWWDNLYLNGTQISNSIPVLGVANTISNNFVISFSRNSAMGVDGVTIGNVWEQDVSGWLGVIGEVVSFPRKLSDTERGQMNTYLTDKWSL